ncbi:MAG: alpha/beta hydrolase [Nitrospirae bacterium]|nr:alpha/beta hydrolase [Nitrospirota bacterium]
MKNSKNRLFLIFLAIILGGCNGIFYQPTPNLLMTPEKLKYTYEDVSFKSLDGTVLNGWFIPGRGNIKGTVLQFHGNGANIGNHYGAVYWLPDEGYNVFLFDYRGYGKSGGTPARQGIQEDGIAALEYIRQRADVIPYPIIIYGQSLGGAVAVSTVATQKQDGIVAVILESSFTGYRAIAREKLGSLWLTWPLQWPLSFLISNEYSPLDMIGKISPVPLLIVHGDADEVIPKHHSETLFKTARKPKTLWIIPGGHHIDAFSYPHQENRKRLLEFLEQALQTTVH